MSHTEHHALSKDTPVRCAVLTISDTRTPATDRSGALIQQRLRDHGHAIVQYHILPDEPAEIGTMLDALAGHVEVVLLNGGTGISHRDTTYEAVSTRLEKTLPGFGELFRMLSFHEIGAAAMLSRATAGLYRGMFLFAMPGSTGAVRLAMDQLIVPELQHIVWELLRQKP